MGGKTAPRRPQMRPGSQKVRAKIRPECASVLGPMSGTLLDGFSGGLGAQFGAICGFFGVRLVSFWRRSRGPFGAPFASSDASETHQDSPTRMRGSLRRGFSLTVYVRGSILDALPVPMLSQVYVEGFLVNGNIHLRRHVLFLLKAP